MTYAMSSTFLTVMYEDLSDRAVWDRVKGRRGVQIPSCSDRHEQGQYVSLGQ